VATDNLQRVQVRVELAGDPVEQTDGAPDEQQLRRYVSDASAEPEVEASGNRVLSFAAEHHPDDREQGLEIRVLAHG
jgi:hypothetical protein